ncbi:MAG: hypothetical protein R3181_03825 [Rubricoccaceae bacterium]|nr:hypothetical protein [Rubricoccaceae bacterium]
MRLPGIRSRAAQRLGGLAWAAALALAAYLAALAGADAARADAVRLLLIGVAALAAVATPHVLLPDPHRRLLQLVNPAPARLFRYQLGQWLPLVGVGVVAAGVLTGGALSSWRLVLEGMSGVLGVGLYAYLRYATLGERSAAWQRGEKGGWYHAAGRFYPPLRFAVAEGYVPTILATADVFLVGSAVAIAGRVLDGTAWAWVPGALLAVGAAARLVRLRHGWDRPFYATSALYAEAFGGARPETALREPLPFASLYWVPRPQRPAVWAGLVQLDRRVPLGRFVALGLVPVVLAAALGAPKGVLMALLLLFVIGKNAAVALASPSLLPVPLGLALHPPQTWAAVRFWMNARWVLPFGLALAAAAVLSPGPGWPWVLTWLAIDLAGAAGAALLVTLARERRALRRYA